MIKNFDKPLAAWRGKERHNGEIIDALTIIFKTRGCRHNRCRMCGYRFERYTQGASESELTGRLLQQLSSVLQDHPPEGYQMVKIFTSGSFLDPEEVPPAARDAILEVFRGKVIIAETRPEFVLRDVTGDLLSLIDDGMHEMPFYVAIGLETTSDFIREKCIDKGFTFEDFLRAAGEAHASGVGVKS
ncbi:MAG TPA: TIGR01210 family radical SAM protein, partial [Methanomicrobiales archaeon]|nr:TIGR01210 family radical SAM protein [Methanomicrobiales archaeon]